MSHTLITSFVLILAFGSAHLFNYPTSSYLTSSSLPSNQTNPIGAVALDEDIGYLGLFPYQVLISSVEPSYTKTYDTKYNKPYEQHGYDSYKTSANILCTGVIVNQNYILVAANCTLDLYGKSRPINNYRVRTALGSIINDQDNRQFVEYTVSQVILNPDYDPSSGNNDNNVALLKVSNPISFNPYVLRACFQFDTSYYSSLIISAYGRITELDPIRIYLKYSSGEEQLRSNCKTETEICGAPTITSSTGLISCRSTYGALLSTPKYDVVGLLPPNPNTEDPCQLPEIYIRLSAYKLFLDDIVGETQYCKTKRPIAESGCTYNV